MADRYETVAFETESGETIYVEAVVSGEQNEVFEEESQEADDGAQKISRKTKPIEKALGLISPIANGVLLAVNKMEERPSEVVATFKASLTSKLELKLVTLSGDSNLEIKITWKG